MRALWDSNVVVSGLAFLRGQAARALRYGWERWSELCVTQWIAVEVERILTTKFHASDVWASMRSRFVVLADPPGDMIAEWVEVL